MDEDNKNAKKKKLTLKQARFCDEYLIDLNATQAAIRAGYSAKTAYSIGGELLKKPEIQALIQNQLELIHSEKIADLEEVMIYLTSVMRGESTSTVVVVEGLGEGVSEARLLEKKPDEQNRLKSAELLGKRFGWGQSATSISVNGTVNIPIVIHDDMTEEDEGD